ncbi:hypothetical protein HRbin09_01269 [bacterium HR09]|nr:hypothetical protein HRbin09_01269 [bacterium HR09]
MFLDQLLGRVGVVKRHSLGVCAGAGVIAPDDEVGAAVVLADNGVPKGFPRPGHTHGQRQKRKGSHAGRVMGEQGLVTPHPGVVVHVPRFGHSHYGMDQHRGPGFLGRLDGELHVGAVHGVAGLKSHDLLPAQAGKLAAELGRGVAEGDKVVMGGELQPLHRAAHIHRMGVVEKRRDPRVFLGVGAVNPLGFFALVRPPDVLHVEHSQTNAFRVPQSQGFPRRKLGGQLLRDVKHDGNGPEEPGGQAHALKHRFVLLGGHEALKGRKTAVEEELQVAELPGRKVPGREV